MSNTSIFLVMSLLAPASALAAGNVNFERVSGGAQVEISGAPAQALYDALNIYAEAKRESGDLEKAGDGIRCVSETSNNTYFCQFFVQADGTVGMVSPMAFSSDGTPAGSAIAYRMENAQTMEVDLSGAIAATLFQSLSGSEQSAADAPYDVKTGKDLICFAWTSGGDECSLTVKLHDGSIENLR